MIAGMMQLEDQTVQWTYLQEARRIAYTVCDGLTGERAKVECDPADFAAAMALAIDPDGGDTWGGNAQETLYELAERAMPEMARDCNHALRWIP